jgi:predicted acyltransferase
MGNPEQTTKAQRLVSLDAYRGFIMLAMASAGFYVHNIVKNHPHYLQSWLWRVLDYQLEHAEWTGGGFWDMIQPSFMFMVGVAIPYSYAARKAKGDEDRQIWIHTVIRAFILIGLAVFLSTGSQYKQPNFAFTNVLGQIGLGYCFVYALRGRGWRVQLGALAGILGVYWLLFAIFPSDAIAPASVGITTEWQNEHWMTGLFTHWNKNINAAARFDQWFLNLFPRQEPFVFERGGYQTLNFVPSMGTMIFGLMAGEKLREDEEPMHKLKWLVWAAGACLVIGVALDWTICPSVKRIWTPSWAIYSTGWTFAMLAAFYWIIDIRGYKSWAFPLVMVGMNSIAVYIMAQLLKGWAADVTRRFLGQGIFNGTYFGITFFSADFEPIARSVGFLVFLLLVSWWMYRQKIFVRI